MYVVLGKLNLHQAELMFFSACRNGFYSESAYDDNAFCPHTTAGLVVHKVSSESP